MNINDLKVNIERIVDCLDGGIDNYIQPGEDKKIYEILYKCLHFDNDVIKSIIIDGMMHKEIYLSHLNMRITKEGHCYIITGNNCKLTINKNEISGLIFINYLMELADENISLVSFPNTLLAAVRSNWFCASELGSDKIYSYFSNENIKNAIKQSITKEGVEKCTNITRDDLMQEIFNHTNLKFFMQFSEGQKYYFAKLMTNAINDSYIKIQIHNTINFTIRYIGTPVKDGIAMYLVVVKYDDVLQRFELCVGHVAFLIYILWCKVIKW